MNSSFQLIIFIFSTMILYTYYLDFDLQRKIKKNKQRKDNKW